MVMWWRLAQTQAHGEVAVLISSSLNPPNKALQCATAPVQRCLRRGNTEPLQADLETVRRSWSQWVCLGGKITHTAPHKKWFFTTVPLFPRCRGRSWQEAAAELQCALHAQSFPFTAGACVRPRRLKIPVTQSWQLTTDQCVCPPPPHTHTTWISLIIIICAGKPTRFFPPHTHFTSCNVATYDRHACWWMSWPCTAGHSFLRGVFNVHELQKKNEVIEEKLITSSGCGWFALWFGCSLVAVIVNSSSGSTWMNPTRKSSADTKKKSEKRWRWRMHPPSCQLRNLKERMGAEERRGEEEGGGGRHKGWSDAVAVIKPASTNTDSEHTLHARISKAHGGWPQEQSLYKGGFCFWRTATVCLERLETCFLFFSLNLGMSNQSQSWSNRIQVLWITLHVSQGEINLFVKTQLDQIFFM